MRGSYLELDGDREFDCMRWDRAAEAKFEVAVQKAGGVLQAVPRNILHWLDIPGVTYAQVKSHLQRYRTAYVAELLEQGEPVSLEEVSEAQIRASRALLERRRSGKVVGRPRGPLPFSHEPSLEPPAQRLRTLSAAVLTASEEDRAAAAPLLPTARVTAMAAAEAATAGAGSTEHNGSPVAAPGRGGEDGSQQTGLPLDYSAVLPSVPLLPPGAQQAPGAPPGALPPPLISMLSVSSAQPQPPLHEILSQLRQAQAAPSAPLPLQQQDQEQQQQQQQQQSQLLQAFAAHTAASAEQQCQPAVLQAPQPPGTSAAPAAAPQAAAQPPSSSADLVQALLAFGQGQPLPPPPPLQQQQQQQQLPQPQPQLEQPSAHAYLAAAQAMAAQPVQLPWQQFQQQPPMQQAAMQQLPWQQYQPWQQSQPPPPQQQPLQQHRTDDAVSALLQCFSTAPAAAAPPPQPEQPPTQPGPPPAFPAAGAEALLAALLPHASSADVAAVLGLLR